MKPRILEIVLFSFILTMNVTSKEDTKPTAGLEVGTKAPAFEALDENGRLWKSTDVVGKKYLVVYFYPAAMTGGCTKQACAFRDHKKELQQLGADVVGVSGDEVKNLQYFKRTQNLNFTLLSDAEGKIAKKFGVPTRQGGSIVRTIDGKEVTLRRNITTSRWTFIIGKDGTIIYRNTKVNAGQDSEQVLNFLKNLAK